MKANLNITHKNTNLKILRWTARIVAIIVVAFFLMMFIGESCQGRSSNAPSLSARDYILLSLMGLYLVGLIIGLWREFLGGLISFLFMAANIIVLEVEKGNLNIFYYMLIPSILYFLSWYFSRKESKKLQDTLTNAE